MAAKEELNPAAVDCNNSNSFGETVPHPDPDDKTFIDIPLKEIGGHRGVENGDGRNDSPTPDIAQAGIKNIEAVSMTWTTWGLILAYLSIFLMAFATSLEGQVTGTVSVFATSDFSSASLLSTVTVVQQVVNAVVKTPMAKVADVFGRLEAFSICILLFVLGYIQQAASRNIQTYAAAQIFYSAGSTGLQILQQVFIADTSNLLNRALWSSLPETPFLVTIWIGAIIGNAIYKESGWRWAYGIWAIILPSAFLPLALVLFLNNKKAEKMGLTAPSPWKNIGIVRILKNTWFELDIGGIVLLSAGFALILIPLTIASKAADGWKSPSIITMIVLGFVCLIIFPIWESNEKLAPRPLIPMYLLKNRSFAAGCGLGFFYFMVFYMSIEPYFYSYLLVVQNQSKVAATHITYTFSFTSTVTAITMGFVIKYTKHNKPWVVFGSCIYLMGIGLMIKYRSMSATVGQIVGTQIAVGIGGGMLNVPAQVCVQASTDHQHVAVATAVYLTCVEIGGAVGSAISGVVWGEFIPAKLLEYLPEGSKDQAKPIFNSITNALAYPVGTPQRMAINRAYQETMTILLTIAICCAVPIIVLSLLLKNPNLAEVKDQVKGRVIGGTVDDDTEVKVVRAEDGMDQKGLGRWLQFPMMKKRVVSDRMGEEHVVP